MHGQRLLGRLLSRPGDVERANLEMIYERIEEIRMSDIGLLGRISSDVELLGRDRDFSEFLREQRV